MLVVTSGLVMAVEVSVLVMAVEGASVLMMAVVGGAPVLVMAAVVVVLVFVAVIVISLVTRVVGVSVLATFEDVSMSVMAVVVIPELLLVAVGRLCVLVMAVVVVPLLVMAVVGVSVLLLLRVKGQNCISASRSVSQRYPESPATVTSSLSLDLEEFLSLKYHSASLQLMHIVSSFGSRRRDLSVGVGSVETSGLAEGKLALNFAVGFGSVVGRRADVRSDEERDDDDEFIEGP